MKDNEQDIEQVLSIKKSKKGFIRRFWWLGLLILVATVYIFLKTDDKKEVIQYKTIKPEQRDMTITVLAIGNLEPTNSVDIGIEVSGTIEEVLVDYNDIVKKGQILAKLDKSKIQAKVNSSKAFLRVAEANLLENKLGKNDALYELQRVQNLFKSTNGNYPPKKEIDKAKVLHQKAKASYQALLARVEQSEAGLKSDEDDLKKAVVSSPIDGIVLDKFIEEGQSVVANMQIPTLFTLAEDLKKMEVVVSIDEADIGKVKGGQKVTFSVDAYPSKIFEGKIEQVRMNSQIVNGIVIYESVVSVNNEALLLRPGMTVSASITTKIFKDKILVPNAALRFSPQKVNKRKGGLDRIMRFGPPPKRKKSKLNVNKNHLWILDQGEAKQIRVKFGDNDGINTIVHSDKITTDTDIIVNIKRKQR